jgi:hypothetical protein
MLYWNDKKLNSAYQLRLYQQYHKYNYTKLTTYKRACHINLAAYVF